MVLFWTHSGPRHQREPKGHQKGTPRGAKGGQRGAQGSEKGTKRESAPSWKWSLVWSFFMKNAKISKTVESCNFENLRKMEKNEGFFEAAYSEKLNKKVDFFNLGRKNNWKNLLNQKMEKKIREKFHDEMMELNYI